MQDVNTEPVEQRQILVVDDTQVNLKLLIDILSDDNYLVRPAISGQAALRFLSTELPDLILLDIMMPEMDGYELCRKIKQDERTRDIPVIFISALNDVSNKISGFEAGGVDFITKPFQPPEILARVATHIELRNYQKKLIQKNAELLLEVEERKKVEAELVKHKSHLEELVDARTRELNKKNIQLIKDIKEKERLQNELIEALDRSEESERLKSSLLSNMNHEFRTPITGVLGMATVLKENTSSAKDRHMLDCIVSSGKRLMKTLNSILEFAQVEANILEKSFHNIDLVRVINSIAGEYADKCKAKGLRLEKTIATDNVIVKSDEKILLQILNNLLENALKFTEKGNVEIACRLVNDQDGVFAEVKVKDSGIGIAKEYHDVIFHEFRQVSEGLARNYEGVGLGLTLVRKLVEIMKGSIAVESELGKGSVFILRLPVAEGSEEKININKFENWEDEINIVLPHDELPLVLLVEDNYINIEVVDMFLEDICRVDSAKTGEEAIKAAKEISYELILMDINLGAGLDGVETTKIIRKIHGYENIPVIALTGYAMESDKDKFLSEGFTNYLAKPFEKEAIVKLVSNVLFNAELTV